MRAREGFHASVLPVEPAGWLPLAQTFDGEGRHWILEVDATEKPRDGASLTGAPCRLRAPSKEVEGGATFEIVVAPGSLGVAWGAGAFYVAGKGRRLHRIQGPSVPPGSSTSPGLGKPVSLPVGGISDFDDLLALRWGPDGRLYGCARAGVSSAASRGGAIWRLDCESGAFDVIATTRELPLALDVDQRGRIFLLTGLVPRVFLALPGSTLASLENDAAVRRDVGPVLEPSHGVWEEAALESPDGPGAIARAAQIQGGIAARALGGAVEIVATGPAGRGLETAELDLDAPCDGVPYRRATALESLDPRLAIVGVSAAPDGALSVLAWSAKERAAGAAEPWTGCIIEVRADAPAADRRVTTSGRTPDATPSRPEEISPADDGIALRRERAAGALRLEARPAFDLLKSLPVRPEDARDRILPPLLSRAVVRCLEGAGDEPVRAELMDWLEREVGEPIASGWLLPSAASWLARRDRTSPLAERSLEDALRLARAAARDGPAAARVLRAVAEELESIPRSSSGTHAGGGSFLDLPLAGEAHAQAVRVALALDAPGALEAALGLARSANAALEERCIALAALGTSRSEAAVRGVAAAWDSHAPHAYRERVIATLASTKAGALALLDAVAKSEIPRSAVGPEIARQLRGQDDPEITKKLESVWGVVAPAPSREIARKLDELRRVLQASTGSAANGRSVFDARCARCHVVNGVGSGVGPELDAARRDDPDALLRSIVDPNESVTREYFGTGVLLHDGRFLQGIIAGESTSTVELRREGGVVEAYDRRAVRRLVPSSVSLMPEGLTAELKDADVRDLFAFLTASPYLSVFAAAGPFAPADAAPGARAGSLPNALPRAQAWRTVDCGSWGELDLSALGLCGKLDSTLLRSVVASASAGRFELRVGSSDSVTVWVGGKVAYAFQGRRAPVRDGDVASVALERGENEVLVFVTNEVPGRSVLYLRFGDPEGRLQQVATRP